MKDLFKIPLAVFLFISVTICNGCLSIKQNDIKKSYYLSQNRDVNVVGKYTGSSIIDNYNYHYQFFTNGEYHMFAELLGDTSVIENAMYWYTANDSVYILSLQNNRNQLFEESYHYTISPLYDTLTLKTSNPLNETIEKELTRYN